MPKLGGHEAKQTTAQQYWERAPDDLEDAYVMRNGRLQEVWDCGIETKDGLIALYGNWPDQMYVQPTEPIFYSPPERWSK